MIDTLSLIINVIAALKIKHKKEVNRRVNEDIKKAIDIRMKNFKGNQKLMISSVLDRSKKHLSVEKVVVSKGEREYLYNDPEDVKRLMIEHFSIIAGKDVTNKVIHDYMVKDHLMEMDSDINPRLIENNDGEKVIFDPVEAWTQQYVPKSNIENADSKNYIYTGLMNLPTDKEWDQILSHLANNKATGMTEISNKMLKQLPPIGKKILFRMLNKVWLNRELPKEWKIAVIFPIAKPKPFNNILANTRPITLLETARKMLTTLMNERLVSILSNNQVLSTS